MAGKFCISLKIIFTSKDVCHSINEKVHIKRCELKPNIVLSPEVLSRQCQSPTDLQREKKVLDMPTSLVLYDLNRLIPSKWDCLEIKQTFYLNICINLRVLKKLFSF